MKIQRTTYLSLGSNLGNKLLNLQQAVDFIAQKVGRVVKISSVYKTKSWGFESDDFLNCCIEVSTHLNPEDLLDTILQIENDLGRVRGASGNYKARIIDIDVLLFDDEIIFYKNLKVPHVKMLERKFVLVPLTEIAANVKHPIAKKTILMCLQGCEDTSEIEETDLHLKRPVSLVEKYNYIAIEGN
ncbi:MAG TPA: 2-amino-4-hydroxy-6-hydroxymethyldihydropteridine diphosphokinase, partial [Flavobacteriia bacterium]|nr:2-amino-4-hydroxy-6-hydroxymethyldihydropteridine diphosphokinase [Flavobacteriia bacterium]